MEDDIPLSRRVLWVLWPAFLVAAFAWGALFTLFDPKELHWFGEPLPLARESVYAIGFFGLWAMTIASSALTVFLERSPWQVNRCPLPRSARPDGCPKQAPLEVR